MIRDNSFSLGSKSWKNRSAEPKKSEIKLHSGGKSMSTTTSNTDLKMGGPLPIGSLPRIYIYRCLHSMYVQWWLQVYEKTSGYIKKRIFRRTQAGQASGGLDMVLCTVRWRVNRVHNYSTYLEWRWSAGTLIFSATSKIYPREMLHRGRWVPHL